MNVPMPTPARGNVVAPVAGEMLILGAEEERTQLHPKRAARGVDEDRQTIAMSAARLREKAAGGPGEQSLIGVLEAYAEEATLAIAHYGDELEHETEAARVGRFHYEIARLYESVLGDLHSAGDHYGRALAMVPDHLPTIVGARRVMLVQGEHEKALDLFDREIRVTADRADKAALMFSKARVLEDHLDRVLDARKVYAAASELATSDAATLKAMELADWKTSTWKQLAETYERSANAVTADPKHRAALVTRRARLIEVYQEDPDGAAELYEDALAIFGRAPGALRALARLHYDRRRWRELIRVLETETDQASDVERRALSMYRIGQLQGQRLGNRKEAIAAMESAARDAPEQASILDALARLYDRAGSHPALAATLGRLAQAAEDPRERLGYLHRIGELCRDELQDDDSAVRAYEAALGIDPSYVPALRALAPMYAAQKKWDLLVAMHEAEAGAVSDGQRRAVAHSRAAEILERAGRKTEAIGHHERSLSLDPQLGASFRALIRLYTLTEDHHKLIELYERAMERVDVVRKIEYLFAIGDLYRSQLDDPEQAEGAYARVLKLDPTHLGAVHALQRAAESAGRWKPLVAALELEVDMTSDKAEIVALLHRAGEVLHEQLSNRVEAVTRFKRVLAIESHHRATLASLGRIYHAEGHWADLVEIYARELLICTDTPSKVALLHKMGEVQHRFLSETDKAIGSFKRALFLDAQHRPSVHALARIYDDLERWKDLVALIETEREHARNDKSKAMAAFRAGEIYEEHLDELAAAEACYAQAAGLRPADAAAADALERVRSHLKLWGDLADDLERRAGESGDAAAAAALLMRAGEVRWDHMGAAPAAIEYYERILAANPSHLGALLAVEPLYARVQAWDKLAATYGRQVQVLDDPGAKAAALSERARILELYAVGPVDELVRCFTQILTIRPGHRGALEGLERLALRTTDARLLSDVDARLSEAVSDAELKSSYLTRQAEALEASGQPQALDIYRAALQLDGSNRGAGRGLRRIAELLGNGIAMVEAAEHEAALALRPERAAEAWVRAGIVQVDHIGDHDAAAHSFEMALARWPDHVEAAERLSELLNRSGEFEVLVERLSRAAAEAQDDARKSLLLIEVSRIHAKELANHGAALSALRRLVESQPKNPEALFELGQLFVSERRYPEAIEFLDRCIASKPMLDMARQAHAMVGRCHEESDTPRKAFSHYKHALELGPQDHVLLERVTALQMKEGMPSAAVETATRLVQIARNDGERAHSLLLLAQAKAGTGACAEATAHLAEAVVLQGVNGRARGEVALVAKEDADWASYASALRGQIDRRGLSPEVASPLFLDISRVQHEQLGSRDDAMGTLIDGLRLSSSDEKLRFELAKRLREAGRLSDAIEQFQYLLMDAVERADAWRSLSETFGAVGRSRESLMATCAVRVLGKATPAEAAEVEQWVPCTPKLPAGALAPAMLTDLFVAGDQQEPAAMLLGALCEGLAKVRPPDLARFGVAGRDKLAPRSEHPLRGLVDALAAMFGVEEFDLYLHRVAGRPVIVENTARPSILVATWLADLPKSQQVFALARALFNLARGVYPVDFLSARDLDVILAASARGMVAGFGQNVATADILDDRLRLIQKALPRKRRRAFEVASEAYGRARPIDMSTFTQWVQQTSRRVALIVSDDLTGSFGVLARAEEIPADQGDTLAARSPVAADLLRVWVSKPAGALRQKWGYLDRG